MRSAAEARLANSADVCPNAGQGILDEYRFDVTFSQNSHPTRYLLASASCSLAAYNSLDIWILVDEYGDAQTLSFASPSFDVSYEDPQETTKVKSITITSYAAQTTLSNSSFDAQTRTLTSLHKWRGLGDAFSAGTWQFRNGRFILKHYEVDASYDGEIRASRIVEFGKAKP